MINMTLHYTTQFNLFAPWWLRERWAKLFPDSHAALIKGNDLPLGYRLNLHVICYFSSQCLRQLMAREAAASPNTEYKWQGVGVGVGVGWMKEEIQL